MALESSLIFFFSSRRRHTRVDCDWSSDVCSSDLQEVVAVAASAEKLHPDVQFISEIGGEDMKTIFFTASGVGKTKQVYMQAACSGGTGTFIEKTARKLQIPADELANMRYE